eukprot:GHVN01004546.1.p1 GENE.GHVN01004546.1~~GHVN01004546.1.p1  ORF type:complete len:212 (-),score=22.50 GHVN01004546.1:518-1153(-)
MFGALESDIEFPSEPLSAITLNPRQGHWASISAFPGITVRKYFPHTFGTLNQMRSGSELHLLNGLNKHYTPKNKKWWYGPHKKIRSTYPVALKERYNLDVSDEKLRKNEEKDVLHIGAVTQRVPVVFTGLEWTVDADEQSYNLEIGNVGWSYRKEEDQNRGMLQRIPRKMITKRSQWIQQYFAELLEVVERLSLCELGLKREVQCEHVHFH